MLPRRRDGNLAVPARTVQGSATWGANICVMTAVSRRRVVTHVWLAALAPLAGRLPDITPARRRRAAVFPAGAAAVRTAGGVTLRTRIAPSSIGAASVTWAVARDRGMRQVVAGGRTSARASDDWLVHVDVAGLGGGVHWFQFRAMGVTSAVGRVEGHDDAAA